MAASFLSESDVSVQRHVQEICLSSGRFRCYAAEHITVLSISVPVYAAFTAPFGIYSCLQHSQLSYSGETQTETVGQVCANPNLTSTHDQSELR